MCLNIIIALPLCSFLKLNKKNRRKKGRNSPKLCKMDEETKNDYFSLPFRISCRNKMSNITIIKSLLIVLYLGFRESFKILSCTSCFALYILLLYIAINIFVYLPLLCLSPLLLYFNILL